MSHSDETPEAAQKIAKENQPPHLVRVAAIIAEGILTAERLGIISLNQKYRVGPGTTRAASQEAIAHEIVPILAEIERFDATR